jgi:predicted nucleic acid-binding protein
VRFVDTNVILYAISSNPDDQDKKRVAYDILLTSDLALSTQVLQEFYVQATRPSRVDRLTHQQASDLITGLTRFPVQATTLDLVRAALIACERYRISYWDAAIIEAARILGCEEVISEDLNHGQDFDGPVIVNPFSREAGARYR